MTPQRRADAPSSAASVVLLRGVNVGGHRTFRPSDLARALGALDVVSIGAAGNFVVRKRIAHATLRAALLERLPFETEVMICGGRDILRLVASAPLDAEPSGRDVVRFVTLLAKRRDASLRLPPSLPAEGPWEVRIVGEQGRFVYGVYRREMRALRRMSQLEALLGVPATTRNWNTITSIARVLEA